MLGIDLRFDARDAVDRGGIGAFGDEHDATFHVLGGEAVVVPHHQHDRDVDHREDVDDHARDRQRAHQQDQQRGDRRGVRPAQGKPHQADHSAGPLRVTLSQMLLLLPPELNTAKWGFGGLCRHGRTCHAGGSRRKGTVDGYAADRSGRRTAGRRAAERNVAGRPAGGCNSRERGRCARHPGCGHRRARQAGRCFKAMAPANGEPTRGVIYADTIHRLAGAHSGRRGSAMRRGRRGRVHLPSRSAGARAPYSRDEVAAAVDACAAIEVVTSRYRNSDASRTLEKLADSISNGAFVHATPPPIGAVWNSAS